MTPMHDPGTENLCVMFIQDLREMEAMVAASIAGLTLYDMGKAVQRDMELTDVRLVEKRGGKSGDWRRDDKTLTASGERRRQRATPR